MELYIVRHGQTILNEQGRVQGRNGEPLNETGIHQAEQLRKQFEDNKIKFDYVYSSPQKRAIQTAQISSGKEVIIDNRLDVFDLGTADRLLKSEVKITGVVPDLEIYKNVEDLEKYKNRIFDFMDEIIKKYGNTDLKIEVVGHKCTVGCISAYMENFKIESIYDDFLKLSSGNGEYKKYVIEGEGIWKKY